jgi:hypothetical protein
MPYIIELMLHATVRRVTSVIEGTTPMRHLRADGLSTHHGLTFATGGRIASFRNQSSHP